MTPAALRTVRVLRALGLPIEIQHKIRIRSDGRPDFSELSDPEFDELMRAARRAYPYLDAPQAPNETPTPP